MNTKTIELLDNNRTKVSFSTTEDDIGFSFWSDSDVLFSEIPDPNVDQQIPIKKEIRFMYKKPKVFYIK
jgi:hypothetical protein